MRIALLSISVLLTLFITTSHAETVLTKTEIETEKKASLLMPAYKATYTLLHKSKPVGTGIRELIHLDNGKMQYHYETDISWMIFSDTRRETTVVSITDNQLTPIHYKSSREGTGRDKSYEWLYDFDNKSATDVKNKKVTTIENTNRLLDKLSYHLQNRIDLINNPDQKHFVYPVISQKGTIKDYEYIVDGEEELKLPYGAVNAVRLKREVVAKNKITYAWFAPELNYLLVKLSQIKEGKQQLEAQLTKLSQ